MKTLIIILMALVLICAGVFVYLYFEYKENWTFWAMTLLCAWLEWYLFQIYKLERK